MHIILIALLLLVTIAIIDLAVSYRRLRRDVRSSLAEFDNTREQFIEREHEANEEIVQLRQNLDNAYLSLRLALKNDTVNHANNDSKEDAKA